MKGKIDEVKYKNLNVVVLLTARKFYNIYDAYIPFKLVKDCLSVKELLQYYNDKKDKGPCRQNFGIRKKMTNIG